MRKRRTQTKKNLKMSSNLKRKKRTKRTKLTSMTMRKRKTRMALIWIMAMEVC